MCRLCWRRTIDHPVALKTWLLLGGDPDLSELGQGSLLYTSTGPYGGYEVTEVLLAAGADPNKGNGRYTPLMSAADWGDLATVRLLLRYGTDPNRRNASGDRAVDIVNRLEGRAEIRAVLEVASRGHGPSRPRRHWVATLCGQPNC
jgi:ankyrin repeat protein